MAAKCGPKFLWEDSRLDKLTNQGAAGPHILPRAWPEQSFLFWDDVFIAGQPTGLPEIDKGEPLYPRRVPKAENLLIASDPVANFSRQAGRKPFLRMLFSPPLFHVEVSNPLRRQMPLLRFANYGLDRLNPYSPRKELSHDRNAGDINLSCAPPSFCPMRNVSLKIAGCQGGYLAVLMLVCSGGRPLLAESNDSLLDLFIKKGFVTEQEAASVKSEADRIHTNTPTAAATSPWKIGKGLKSAELFGDVRLRFEDRKVEDPSGGSINLQRMRYSLRLGLRGDLYDQFYYGLRMDTAANGRSPWVTMGTSTSGSTYQGPFGKSTAGINLGQAYIGWKPVDGVDLTAGKMPNPLYVTPMVWDSDLNPEGFAEKFKATVGEADLFANFGQFLYQDTNPQKASAGYFFAIPSSTADLPFLLAWQAGFNYHLTEKVSLKVAPVIYNYLHTGSNPSTTSAYPDFSGIYVGEGSTNNITSGNGGAWSGYPNGYYDGFTANQTGLNNLQVLEIPWELNWQLTRVQWRLFGDYAQNLDGAARARAAYAASRSAFSPLGGGDTRVISSAQTADTKAYQFGLGVGTAGLNYGPTQGMVYGSSGQRHAWEVRGYWQHVEQYALDPNLVDSDFFEGRLNMEGFFGAISYALTENILGTVRYGYASRINDQLGTGGSNLDIPQMNPVQHYNLFQVDLSLRF